MDQSPPTVAAFDLDGTLTEGGSVFLWLRHLAGRRAVIRAAAQLALPLAIGGLRSGPSADRAKERLFHQLLAGRPLAEVAAASRTFAFEHLEAEGRTPLLERLAWHQSQGHDVVLVSASPQLYVDVMAEALGAVGAIGTRLAVDARGTMTGGYLGHNCRGGEKMRRLDEWIAERHYASAPVIYAYGNSRGDRRLLGGADHPFNVGKLGRFGALRRFPPLPRTTAGE